VQYADTVSEELRTLIFDPQTAGGLLISVPEGESAKMAAELKAAGLQAGEIGEVVENGKPLIRVE
jgi:selenide, water dikinase